MSTMVRIGPKDSHQKKLSKGAAVCMCVFYHYPVLGQQILKWIMKYNFLKSLGKIKKTVFIID